MPHLIHIILLVRMFSVPLFGIMFPPRSKDHLTKIMCFYHVVFLQKTALSARLVVSPSREDALSPHYFVKLALLVSCCSIRSPGGQVSSTVFRTTHCHTFLFPVVVFRRLFFFLIFRMLSEEVFLYCRNGSHSDPQCL